MKRALQILRLILCLTVIPAGFAFLGVAGAVDGGGNETIGLVVGALVGVFFGLVFSGYNFRWFVTYSGRKKTTLIRSRHDYSCEPGGATQGEGAVSGRTTTI
jgi:hypothetical protein